MAIADKLRGLLSRRSEPRTIISVRSDRLVVVSSILIIFLLGLPLWWTTTRVYRAELPHEAIEKYSPQDALVIPFTFYLDSNSSLSAGDIEAQVKEKLNRRLSYAQDEWRVKYDVKVLTGKAPDVPGHYTLDVLEAGVSTTADFATGRKVRITAATQANMNKVAALWLANIVAKEEKLVRLSLRQSAASSAGSAREAGEIWSGRALKYSPEYSITFTLLNDDPVDGVSTDWDIEAAAAQYIQPFVDRLKPLAKLSISSQILHHAGPLPIDPIKHDDGTHLTPKMLPHFANSPSWNLASTDPISPMLNFILYVPSLSSQPMHVVDSARQPVKTNAFLVSQWGGIAIANLRPDQLKRGGSVVFSKGDMQKYMGVFIAQLRSLIGIRNDIPLEHTESSMDGMPPTINLRRATHTGISDWEFDALSRQWLVYNRQKAITTLQSLVNLTDSMQNMVVMDEIKTQVDQSLAALGAIETALRMETSNHLAAFELAANASAFAEGAFFDPSMVSLLYFPDQHKYAIYLPFFLPVAIPLLHAIKKVVKEAK
ncbi:hypothetical protein GQ54DRAFT_300798, partial [Martensiomyces pterosporus]